jgi:hypothetical protein
MIKTGTAANQKRRTEMKLHEIKISATNGIKTIKPSCAQLGLRRYYQRALSKRERMKILNKANNSKHLQNVFGAMNFCVELEVA